MKKQIVDKRKITRIYIVFSVVLFLYMSSISWSQAQQFPVDLQLLMTSTMIRQTGLQKLTPQELNALNDWLEGYSLFLTSKAESDCKANSSNKCSEVVESNIKGSFNGWDGETIFPLDNGQIWQQSEYGYEYAYEYHPEVLIYCLRGKWKMHVEGIRDPIAVRRLK